MQQQVLKIPLEMPAEGELQTQHSIDKKSFWKNLFIRLAHLVDNRFGHFCTRPAPVLMAIVPKTSMDLQIFITK